MKINKSSRFEPLIFLLIAALFFSAGVKFEIRLFAVWGIVSVVFAAVIFLIHKFSKRRTENVYVPLFFLFAGCLVICAGLFELRDKLLILVGGVFMAFGVLLGFLFSSEGRRIKDEKLRNSIRMPSEYIVLFAVKETEENDDVKWYVIDKRTGRAYVFTESKYALTDFGTVRMLACSKYARCFMVDEMKKRSFWADFSEDNWWKKLKIKFDKTQSIDILQNKDESNSDGTTRDYRKIGLLREAIIDKVQQERIECYLLKMLIGEDAAKCFPEFEKVMSANIILDLKKRMRLARVSYDCGRRINTVVLRADAFYALTQKCDKMNEYAFMKLESDWELLFDTRLQNEIARSCESEYASEAAGAVQKTTFVCKKCKKEKEIKFLHKDETCADCCSLMETEIRKPVMRSLKATASSKDDSNTGAETQLYLGKREAESKNEETQLNKSATKSNAPEKKKVSSGLFEITTEQQKISCESFECEVRTADVRSDRRESGIDERKVASKLAIKLSKEYYYIGNDNSFWLFLSRNRETLLGIYALSYQKEYIEFETKKVAVSEYTIDSSECVGKVIADCFGRSMKELDCEQLFRILYSVMGYEYISSRRLETLFSLKDKEISWEYYENISYDRATGQPYFVRERVTQSGHGWISDYSVKRISYDEVAKKALVYAPASKFINISDTNWREILDFTPDGDDLSTTYTYTTGKLNETSMFEVFVSFDEHNEYLYKKRLQRDLCPEQIHGLTETYKDSDISGLMKYDAECMQRIDKIAHSDQKNMTFPNMNYSVNKLAGRKLLEAIRKGEFEKFLMAAPGYRFDTDRNFPEMNNYSEQFHALNEYGKSNREFENELIQALRNCLKERGRFGYAYHIVRIICEQVLYERNGKNSMDFITDDLLKELREMILLNKEKLMDYKEWDGKLYEDGMYGALKYHCDFISAVSGDKYKIL